MCPEPERLVELVEGHLDPDAQLAIEHHIDTCESCRVGLAAAVRGDAASAWSLGRYRIDDVIGMGGMGIVYRAWDPSLSREVAIKVVKSDDAELRARLAREAQSLARLNHRNVCQIYDVGTDDNELWIAMELVRGTTLRAWIAAKPERRDEVLEVLAGAGHGLAAAHAAGLVHRDVKPENILVDRDGRAVVSDFGLARDLADRATRTSVLAGTPAYMAPEQLDGAPADARSDQYAFAVTAHEALTGTRPRPRNQASASLPSRLRAALDRALSDDPGARFATVEQLVDAFVVPAPRRRMRGIAITAAVAGLAVVGVAGVSMSGGGGSSGGGSSSHPGTVAVASDERPQPQVPVVAHDAPFEDADRARPTLAPHVDPVRADPPAPVVGGNDASSHITAIQRAVASGDGKSCMAEFAALERLEPPEHVVKPMALLRSQCLMLAGQCDAGKQAARAHWQSYDFTEQNVEKAVDGDVALHCREGARTERDRLLRAMFVLGDASYKHTLAECRDAYAEAKQLVGKVPSGDPMDMLHDAKGRLGSYAPGCFARAGDCPTAWRIAKELDASSRRDSNDFTKRSAFVHAVGLACVDQDQGTLSDAETVWRSIAELDRVRQAGTRTVAYCDTRIDRATAALRRLGGVSSDPLLRHSPATLAEEAADCLAVTVDCATAWQRFAALVGGTDEQVRKKFRRAARMCVDFE